MRDGRTRKLKTKDVGASDFGDFLNRFSVRVVLVSGPAAGQEILLDRVSTTFGRGPGVDVAFDDATMSRQHAAIEFSNGSFRIRDLGSTNGMTVNNQQVQAADLDNGDRFELGALEFQLAIHESEPAVETCELPTGA